MTAQSVAPPSQIFLEKMAGSIPGWFYTLEQHTENGLHFTYISPGLETLQGLKPEAVIANVSILLAQLHPDDRCQFLATLANSQQTLQPFTSQWRVTTASGQQKRLQCFGRPEQSPEQDIVWYGMVLAETEPSVNAQVARLNQELRDSQEKFQLAFEDANVGICLVDLQGRLFRVNAKMSEMFGYSPSELEMMTVNDLALPEDQWVSPNFIERAIAGELDKTILEKRYRHRDGHILYGEVSTSLVRDSQGQPLYFISHVKDITPRKIYEQELRISRDKIAQINTELEARVAQRTAELHASERLLRYYFDQSLVGMAITSPDKGWLNVNPKFCEILGYSFAELQTMTWPEITYPDDLAQDLAHFEEVLRGDRNGYEMDKRFIHKKGHLVYAHLAVQAHRQTEGSLDFCVVMLQDIGDRKRAEQAMQKALLREQELNELRAHFVTAISHQLRTPLTVIASSASILEKFAPKLSAQRQQEHFQAIHKNVRVIVNLIEDIVLINANPSSNIELALISQELVPFCENIKTQIEYLHPGYTIHFTHHLNAILLKQGLRGKFAPDLLQPMLVHLLSNAVKYSPMDATIMFSLVQVKQKLVFKIGDMGIGILEGEKDAIFEPFYRGKNVGHIAGIGLGLAIVKKMLELYPGRIFITPRRQRGTVVSLVLPIL